MDFYNLHLRDLRSPEEIIRDLEIHTCDLYGSIIELTLRGGHELDKRTLEHAKGCPKCTQILRKWQG